MTESQLLRPESLPLKGCHLIEASAGTGKTFNITRIYLRLLLERKLDVKNILERELPLIKWVGLYIKRKIVNVTEITGMEGDTCACVEAYFFCQVYVAGEDGP